MSTESGWAVGSEILQIVSKAIAGGLLVSLISAVGETLSPKRFAGVFSAAPSVALAGLLVTVGFEGPLDARRGCIGMVSGAVAFVVYATIAPPMMRRLGVLKGSAAAVLAWAAVSFGPLPLAAAAASKTSAAQGATVHVSTLRATAAAAAMPRRSDRQRPKIKFQPGKLGDTKPKDMFIRFAFGAGVSAAAGVLSATAGPLAGGPLLASPAILLASLTLIADEDGKSAARDDARGAVAGAIGLIAFALLGAALFTHVKTLLVFIDLSAAWTVVALGAYSLAWLARIGNDEPH